MKAARRLCRRSVAFLGLCAASLSLACEPVQRSGAPLPERSIAPDLSALGPSLDSAGGPVIFELTGWVRPEVIEAFVERGLQPLPGYDAVERLDSLGLNSLGGVVPPRGLYRFLELRYIVRVRPAPPDSAMR